VSRRVYAGGQILQEWDDATRTYRDADGERPYTEDEAAPLVQAERVIARESTRATLLARVDAAIVADLDYLDTVPPATASDRLTRVETQVDRLTRQSINLLRLAGERLDGPA